MEGAIEVREEWTGLPHVVAEEVWITNKCFSIVMSLLELVGENVRYNIWLPAFLIDVTASFAVSHGTIEHASSL